MQRNGFSWQSEINSQGMLAPLQKRNVNFIDENHEQRILNKVHLKSSPFSMKSIWTKNSIPMISDRSDRVSSRRAILGSGSTKSTNECCFFSRIVCEKRESPCAFASFRPATSFAWTFQLEQCWERCEERVNRWFGLKVWKRNEENKKEGRFQCP